MCSNSSHLGEHLGFDLIIPSPKSWSMPSLGVLINGCVNEHFLGTVLSYIEGNPLPSQQMKWAKVTSWRKTKSQKGISRNVKICDKIKVVSSSPSIGSAGKSLYYRD